MAALKNSINEQIFTALKISEKVKESCPVLLIGNPGVGKTKSVYLFAEVRDYHVVILRGNSESYDSILGYQTAPTDTSKDRSTIRLRPDWFQEILDYTNKGQKCLLFLDEITTAPDLVQAALLHLVFERKVGKEALPESTLVVAAGNYANNLSNSMIMLAPLLNRFCIFNIIPKANDVRTFLSRYKGSLTGNRVSQFDTISDILKDMDSQETEYTPEVRDKIGEYIERQTALITEKLATTGEKPIDFSVTELSSIYSDLEGDAALPGFVTFRSLGYFVEMTIAMYICFGKEGIRSDNYKNLARGLVGVGVSRSKKGSNQGEVKLTPVYDEYCDAMAAIINDIEKMNNNKLPEYEKFFSANIQAGSILDTPTLTALINKFKELRGDRELDSVDRPLDPDLLKTLGDCLVKTAQKVIKHKVNADANANVTCPVTVEQYSGDVCYWNQISQLAQEYGGLIRDPKRGYDSDASSTLENTITALRKSQFKLKTIRKMLLKQDPASVETTAEIRNITQ